jgi:hypothetical protein
LSLRSGVSLLLATSGVVFVVMGLRNSSRSPASRDE